MSEWSQAVWIAVGLLLSASLVLVSTFYLRIVSNINNEISRQEANRVLMQEYREFNGYNDRVVYPQDITTIVLRERGAVGVRIMRGTSLKAYWVKDNDIKNVLQAHHWIFDPSKEQTTYSATGVQDLLDLDYVYKSTLTYGPNNEVIGVTFQRGILNGAGEFEES